MMSFFFYERQQRRAFLEARQSLEAKIILEEESEEQVSYTFLKNETFLKIFLC